MPIPGGRRVYTRTVQFVLFLAIRQLYPNAVAKMNFYRGRGSECDSGKEPAFTPADVPQLKERVAQLVAADIPLRRKRIATQEAIAAFTASGQTDQARLLAWRKVPYFDVYTYGDYLDYFMGRWPPALAISRYGIW